MKIKTIYHNLFGSFSNFAFLLFTGIILVPFYFKYISVDDYGIWLGGISFVSLLTVLEANISLILTQKLADKWTNKKPVEFSKYFSASIIFCLAISSIIIISTFFLKDTLVNWVSSNLDTKDVFSKSFFFYSIALSLIILNSYLGAIPQVFLKTLMPPIFNIISSIIGIAYTIYAVSTQGVLAIALGSLIKPLIYLLFLSFYVLKLLNEKNIYFYFDIIYLKKLIKSIGLPLISKVGVTLTFNAQNFIVAAYITSTATTIFDITRKFPLIIQTVINMVAVSTFTAFTLFYSEQRNSSDSNKYLDHFFSTIRVLMLASLLGIFLLGKDLITIWVGGDKYGGDLLFALLCLTALTDQFRMMMSQQYYALGKFNLSSITDLIFSILFIIVAFLLIPTYKLYGIPTAGIISAVIYIVLCFYLEKKNNINVISYLINKKSLFNIFGIILISIMMKFSFENFIDNFFVKSLFTLIVVFILFLLFYLRKKSLIKFIFLKITNFKIK